jgi:hypothetical protein
MLTVLVVAATLVVSLGLLGLFAVARCGQCSRLLEPSPDLGTVPQPWELPRAA